MIRRCLICVVLAGVAQSTFAGAVQDGIATEEQAPDRARDSTHATGHAIVWSSAAICDCGTAPEAASNTAVKDEKRICSSYTAPGCGYGSGPTKPASLWGLRLTGGSVRLAIFGADISVQPRSARLSKSFRF